MKVVAPLWSMVNEGRVRALDGTWLQLGKSISTTTTYRTKASVVYVRARVASDDGDEAAWTPWQPAHFRAPDSGTWKPFAARQDLQAMLPGVQEQSGGDHVVDAPLAGDDDRLHPSAPALVDDIDDATTRSCMVDPVGARGDLGACGSLLMDDDMVGAVAYGSVADSPASLDFNNYWLSPEDDGALDGTDSLAGCSVAALINTV